MATPAKTVSKGGGKAFRNTLDLPFKLKWPYVAQKTAAEILSELVRSLEGVRFTPPNKKNRRRREREKRLGKDGQEDGDFDNPHPAKKMRLNSEEIITAPAGIEPGALETANSSTTTGGESLTKRSQLVVGVNEVTRAMEKGTLRAAVVCLSAKPALLHEHLQMLAATRNIPCIALSTVSDTIAPVLGLKRATTIGLKKLQGSDTVDHFSKLANLISKTAPKIEIPWLKASNAVKFLAETEQPSSQPLEKYKMDSKEQQTPLYLPLIIKKTIITPKKRKR